MNNNTNRNILLLIIIIIIVIVLFSNRFEGYSDFEMNVKGNPPIAPIMPIHRRDKIIPCTSNSNCPIGYNCQYRDEFGGYICIQG